MGQHTSVPQPADSSSSSVISKPGGTSGVKSIIRQWSCRRLKATSSHALGVSFETAEPKQDITSTIRPIVAQFIHRSGHKPSAQLDNDRLWSSSLEKASSMEIPCPENSANWKRLKVGFAYAHHCYPNHPHEVQVYIAVYTLLAQNLDDFTPEGMQNIELFFQRLCAGEQQPTTVLRGWAQLMLEAHKYWSPIAANLIITSSLNMITSTIIEHGRLVRQETQIRSGRAWAYYLRNLDGLGEAFAVFTFPSAVYPDVSQFLQAIPDMSMYIVHANDIISFYKEELQGEKDNYVHSRARYDSKDVVETLKDIVEETEACYHRVRKLLVFTGCNQQVYAKAWQAHEQGTIDFHLCSRRYKLKELGLTT